MDILDNGSGATNNNEPFNTDPAYELSEHTKKQIQRLIKADKDQLQRNDAYYEKMRKDNLTLYRSAKVSEQRFRTQ